MEIEIPPEVTTDENKIIDFNNKVISELKDFIVQSKPNGPVDDILNIMVEQVNSEIRDFLLMMPKTKIKELFPHTIVDAIGRRAFKKIMQMYNMDYAFYDTIGSKIFSLADNLTK